MGNTLGWAYQGWAGDVNWRVVGWDGNKFVVNIFYLILQISEKTLKKMRKIPKLQTLSDNASMFDLLSILFAPFFILAH